MTIVDPAAFCSLFPGLSELVELYRELDREIARFKKAAALDCLEFCRACCTVAEEQIEVSIFECLPVSLHLWGRGEGESYLQRIAANGGNNRCVLYTPGNSLLPDWGCAQYAWRPLLCRLFGFSSVLDKHGRPRIALCRAIKEEDPQAESRVNQKIAGGLEPMIIRHWAEKASSLNPHLGRRRHPINQSLRLALEKVGFQAHLLQAEGGEKQGPDQEEFKENPAEDRFYRGQR
jgi:Fe-S-cluster containining protein